MSFDLICSSCGAPSGPSVGVCPFCKSVMAGSSTKKISPAYSKLLKLYNEGDLETSLHYVQEIQKTPEKHESDPDLLLLCSKILIESEGPNGKTRTLLGSALLVAPDNAEIIDYLEIIQARFSFSSESYKHGKETLAKVLQRSPNNPHALFLMGSHLFWREKNHMAAIPHLEKCVRVRPHFLRAWACLATIAQDLGNPQLAENALLKCVKLEKNPHMRSFFEGLLKKLSPNKKAA